MQEKFDDSTLMAYADGELDAETRREIEQALAGDVDLAARLSVFTRTRQTASEALEPLLDVPVPDALASSIAQMVERHESQSTTPDKIADNVVAFDRKPRFMAPRLDLALAASVALVAGGILGYLASGSNGAPSTNGVLAAQFNDPGLPSALATVASGEELSLDGGGRFRAIASFRDEAGSFCREFEVDNADASTVVSVACEADGQWRVRFSVAAASADDGFAPASSLEALDAYLMAIGASEPLSDDDERASLGGLR